MSAPERHRFTVVKADQGLRLDQLLAARIDGLSRRRARVLLDIGGVYVDGHRVKTAGRKLRAGQKVEAVIGSALSRATGQVGDAARARDLQSLPPLTVVFEDDDIVIIDKPAGVLAAPTPEGDRGNVADQLSRRHSPKRPVFVVHRIDLPTSGLLVYAKTPAANRHLSELFRTHSIGRTYDAVVVGSWPAELTRIDDPIEGRAATTHFEVVAHLDSSTHLAVTLETGRTHQIRIHCAGAGHPIVGDRKYGRPTRGRRLALHARELSFVHPTSGESVEFVSDPPTALFGPRPRPV